MAEGNNIPEAAKLDVGSPVIEVEGVEILDKDGTELTVVEEMDRAVVEVDLCGTSAETDEPHEGGDPPGESRTIALPSPEPRFVLVCKFLVQHCRGHGRLEFFDGTELRGGGIGTTTGTVEGLDRR